MKAGDVYSAQILPDWSGIDTVFSSLPRHLFQRSNSFVTSIPIRGKTFGSVSQIRVQATQLETNQVFQPDAPVNPTSKTFSVEWSLPPGDYRWDFNVLNTASARTFRIDRAGIGEVFLAWGHSFMQGPGIGSAASDPRCRTVKTYYQDPAYNNNYFQNIAGLPVTFETISSGDLGPFQGSSWIFGRLADSLVKKLQMPVLIYSVAFGGFNIYQNKQNILNQPFGYPWFGEGVL